MQHWIKSLYGSDRKEAPDWRSLTWVSDGPAGRKPQYAVGDELLLYNVPSRRFPARARVTGETEHDPPLVNREGGPGEGRRWPFVTPIKVLGALDLSVAPTPLSLGVAVTQGGHRRIEQDVYERAARDIEPRFPKPPRAPMWRPTEIEQQTEEPFEQRSEQLTRTAYRREQALVQRLAEHLRRSRDHHVWRHAIRLGDGTELRTDLFDQDTGLLVEAKASSDRPSIRMAVGQLLDYEQFISPKPKWKAVLVPDRPADDLVALLDTLNIAAIWASSDTFRDNRRGRLV